MAILEKVNLSGYEPVFIYAKGDRSGVYYVTPTQDKFQQGLKSVISDQTMTENLAKEARNMGITDENYNSHEGIVIANAEALEKNGMKLIPK